MALPLSDISGGYIVKEVQGLGPVKATLVSSSFANQDGAQYQSGRRESRNVIIKLRLDPGFAAKTVQELRSELYQFFMPKTTVTLGLNLFNRSAQTIFEREINLETVGRIESCEPDIFAKEPTVDISVMCFDPDLVDPITEVFEGLSTTGLTETALDYKGTSETGFVFKLLANQPITEFTIYQRTPDDRLRSAQFWHSILNQDVITVNSVFGQKGVIRTRDGVERSILYNMSPQSNWLQLEPGINHFRIYAWQASADPVPFTIEYTNKYGGL